MKSKQSATAPPTPSLVETNVYRMARLQRKSDVSILRCKERLAREFFPEFQRDERPRGFAGNEYVVAMRHSGHKENVDALRASA